MTRSNVLPLFFREKLNYNLATNVCHRKRCLFASRTAKLIIPGQLLLEEKE